MAVNQPWDGSAARFTDAQYQRSCVLDRAVCGGPMADAPPKQRCSLPIREPSGAVNANAVTAAAGRLNQITDACPAAKSRAARALANQYRQLPELGDPPPDLARMAGGAGMTPADHMQDIKRGA